jgi:hypothetical protein
VAPLEGQIPIFISPQNQTHVTTDGQSIVLVSSPLWNLKPDITFFLKLIVVTLWGALYDERSGLSLGSHFRQD